MKCINKIILWIVIWFSLSLTGCGNNAEKLAEFGKEQFEKYDYKIESRVLNVEGRLIFESDKIEDFYTAEYNGQAAEHLAKILKKLRQIYYEEPVYTYTNKNGTVVLTISNGVSKSIKVRTSFDHTYELSYYTDNDIVEINGNWVYCKEREDIFTKEDIEVKNNAPEFPYVGMSEEYLIYTSLGKPDSVEKCNNFDSLVARARWKKYEWNETPEHGWYRVTVEYRKYFSHNTKDYIDLPASNGYVSSISYYGRNGIETQSYSY